MKKLLILVVVLSALLSVWQVNLVSGLETGTIIVHKFHDVNRNGVQDAGEEDIGGWLIRLYTYDDVNGLQFVTAEYTDSEGVVTFSDLPPYSYKVWEQKLDCWEPTTPVGEIDGGYYVFESLGPGESITVEFGNEYTCVPDGEGCTPGFWKNLRKRLEAWGVAGYAPTDDFEAIFGVDLGYSTLGEAVKAKGGGDNKLARHGTAALLNAAHPDVEYPLTVDEVIAIVQGLDPERDVDTLVEYNELLAPGFCD